MRRNAEGSRLSLTFVHSKQPQRRELLQIFNCVSTEAQFTVLFVCPVVTFYTRMDSVSNFVITMSALSSQFLRITRLRARFTRFARNIRIFLVPKSSPFRNDTTFLARSCAYFIVRLMQSCRPSLERFAARLARIEAPGSLRICAFFEGESTFPYFHAAAVPSISQPVTFPRPRKRSKHREIFA